MIEYKVMNREELTNYIFNFWYDWGAFNYEDRTDEEIKAEIYNNLETLDGVERELNFFRHEFDAGWDENSLEYQNLNILCNYINWYKTDLQNKIIEKESNL